MADLLRSHQRLYNGCLEQRIDAWRRRRISLSYQDQCKELTDLRHECPEFAAANCSSQQRTLRRLDIAFQAFFRRVKERGEMAGFPRFKSFDIFGGIGFKSHGDGWRFTPGLDWKLAFEDGTSRHIDNPRRVKKAARALKVAQRALARKKRGGKNRQRARKVVGKLHQKLANQRKEFLHQTSAALIGEFALIATEKLAIRKMTGSAKGTAEQPGKNVKAKAGLNREILDTAPGGFLAMLRYKAPEAGSDLMEAPTRKLKPSQTCPACGRVQKKKLSQRTHACPCGHVEQRDAASGRVVLNWALAQLFTGREPIARQPEISPDSSPTAGETPSHALAWVE